MCPGQQTKRSADMDAHEPMMTSILCSFIVTAVLSQTNVGTCCRRTMVDEDIVFDDIVRCVAISSLCREILSS